MGQRSSVHTQPTLVQIQPQSPAPKRPATPTVPPRGTGSFHGRACAISTCAHRDLEELHKVKVDLAILEAMSKKGDCWNAAEVFAAIRCRLDTVSESLVNIETIADMLATPELD